MKYAQHLERAEVQHTYSPPSLSWAQLEAGEFKVGYSVINAAPIAVSMRTYNVAFQVEATLAPGKAVVVVTAGSQSPVRWFGAPMDHESIVISRDCVDVRTDGASSFFAVTIDESLMDVHFPTTPDAAALVENLRGTKVSRHGICALRLRYEVARLLARRIVLPPMLSGTLVPLLADALDHFEDRALGRPKSLNRRLSAVRICEAHMREHVDDTITLLDLSRVSGMRSRSLINAFEAVTGCSPMEYLKHLRLNGVRRALQRPRKGVSRIIDVATAWGFWHMGHFAADYRAMFGETPSQTLLT